MQLMVTRRSSGVTADRGTVPDALLRRLPKANVSLDEASQAIELDSNHQDDQARVSPNAISFSVVICTDGRLPYLRTTLESLLFLSHDHFEVCVVCGPTEDGTAEFVAGFGHGVKIARCPRRNLAIARNIGIAMAGGDIVAFIDDDAIPESEWLDDLAKSYENAAIGAAGGFVFDNTGVNWQAKYVTINRLGYPDERWSEPAPHLNFPYSSQFPHLLGANCSFRRDMLLELGGFDEEYEYFLDETDLCCRVNDAGYQIDQRCDARVHHKYAPSCMRDERRIVSHWHPLIKNRVYFAMRNGRRHHALHEIIGAGLDDIHGWEQSIRGAVASGQQSPADLERFTAQAEAAMAEGMAAGREPSRKLLSAETLATHARRFSRFTTRLPTAERLTIALVTQDYPPGQNGGIARNVHEFAGSLARAGHGVHVFTRARAAASVDFEDGVWVHRVAIRRQPPPPPDLIAPYECPGHIWDYSRTMLQEVRAIDARTAVDVVYCPLWDCEPIAFVIEGKFPLVCALQTTMRFWLESQPQKALDRDWMRRFGLPIIAMEELIIARAPLLHANSRAILEDIKRKYKIGVDERRVFVCPHGMRDWADAKSIGGYDDKEVRLLFVGRLESRKGIDTLLAAAPEVLRRFPSVVLDIVGDDTIPRADGKTYKQAFLEQRGGAAPDGLRFHGRVEEHELRAFYRECDIFLAPSRYESFGLVYLEAMMFGKPTIGGDAGGVPEVIANGDTGLLVPPGDPEALKRAIARLLEDRESRWAMGQAGRAAYEEKFTVEAVRDQMLAAITQRLALTGDKNASPALATLPQQAA